MTPLVFLHGWGQSARVWYGQREAFPEALFLNLPGHGGAPESGDWCATLAAQLPEEACILVGWSLGGMLAIKLARQYPERIAGLVLVSTSPRFRNSNDWPHGCSDEVFGGFVEGVATQSAKTLGRFFTLMLHGEAIERRDFNELARLSIDREQPPTPEGLRHGLQMLAELDLRGVLPEVRQPALVLHGEADAIIPVAAGRYLSEQLPAADWHSFPGCGHAPFLTRTVTFNARLEEWCQTISIAA
ncbi:MAG TPA: alpha/beta fold hydrolase [Mariprofundaceae bacterium]|nr:alpha/beta fold hydrolase [Mariprofundaceae bacterium]